MSSDIAPPIIPSHIPFDQTYVLYDPNDIISVISVQFTLLPVYIMVFYLLWFLVTREIEPVIVVAGHLCSEIVNKVLKVLLKNPRPDFHRDFGGDGSLSYGMPSAHSQFIGFFAAYYICIAVFKIPNLKRWQKLTWAIILTCVGLGVAESRVYLMYHTWQQVVVGVIVGVVFGIFYFIFSSLMRDVGIVDWVLSWPIINYFHVKDSYHHCYQSFSDEYMTYWQQRRRVKESRKNI